MKKYTIVFLAFILIALMSSCTEEKKIPGVDIIVDPFVPQIIESVYDNNTIVADKLLSKDYYDVDPTGVLDSTDAINQAIQDVYNLGGGTVFLPEGKYLVTGNITVLPFVTLYGDYNDPDNPSFNGQYGTMIYADVLVSNENFPALFTVGGSAGVVGMTVYYPKQDISQVKPYPFTFEIPSFASDRAHADHMAPTIKNVTMINAYKGVAASITSRGSLISAANEQIHLENIKGTVLYLGFELYNSSEYGVVQDITLNNSYWASASSFLTSPDLEDITNFTKTYGMGMLMGDLEWVVFTSIHLADYSIGIRLYDGLRRYIAGQPEIYFIGQFYNLNIQNTKTALRVDNMYPNFGITIADSVLQGDLYSIRNMDSTNSQIKIIGTQLIGKTNGKNIIESGGESSFASSGAQIYLNFDAQITQPNQVFINAVSDFYADITGIFDSSIAIQNALDYAESQGGGIVYLPSGYYRVNSPLTIPSNTQLRGSSSVNHRDEIGLSIGTVILANYGYNQSEEMAKETTALITIEGDNSGIVGLRISYPENEPDLDTGDIRFHSFTIRVLGDNDYIQFVSLHGSTHGIEVLGTQEDHVENTIIKNVNGTFYRIGVRLEYAEQVILDEILSNATVVSRHGLANVFPLLYGNTWPSDANGTLGRVYDVITRPFSKFINVIDSTEVFVANSFTFGSNTFLYAKSSDITVYNSSGDNLYHSGYLLDLNDSNFLGVNIMRYSGQPLNNNGSTITLFNRLSLLEIIEKDIVNNELMENRVLVGSDLGENDLPEIYVYVES